MGRGKGRSKGIDVTKHFLQTSGLSDRITVQISPLQAIQVHEEEVSPTRGSEAAFSSKREGRADTQMKLCVNWKEGACHSHAACSNAHILAHFNTPALPSLGNGVFSTQVEPLQLRDDADWQRRTLPLQPQQQQQKQQQQQQRQSQPLQQQHQFSPGTEVTHVSVEPKASETLSAVSPASSRVQHGSLIPAPRSQQFRQATPGISGPATLPSNNTSWSRKVMSGVMPSPHANHSVNSNSKSHNGTSSVNYTNYNHQQQQQQQQQHQQQRARNMQDWSGRRIAEDNSIGDMGLHMSTGNKSPAQGNRTRRGQFIELLENSAHSSDLDNAWVNPVPAQSAGTGGIWYDTGAALWDVATEDATAPADAFVVHELAARHGDPWESFDSCGAANPSEASKQRFLRDFVGSGADAGALPTPPKSEGRHSPQTAPMASGVSELMSLLGGHAERRAESVSDAIASPPRSVNTVKDLMALLTTE